MTSELRGSAELIDRLRRARARRSVVKMRFVTLRGAAGKRPIFVFEGDDDKVVYGRWINRIRHTLRYEVFLCDGKAGVRELKETLDSDLGGLSSEVFYFVDHDYDGLEKFRGDNVNVFVTPTYSFENFLVSAHVLDSVLRDEFPLHEKPSLRESICLRFSDLYKQFLFITGQFNWHLFLARRMEVELTAKPPARISSYATFSVETVQQGPKTVQELVQTNVNLESLITPELEERFKSINPINGYRGKNALMFFTGWLRLLAAEFQKRETCIFNDCNAGSVRETELTIGGLASRSLIPQELYPFLDKVPAL